MEWISTKLIIIENKFFIISTWRNNIFEHIPENSSSIALSKHILFNKKKINHQLQNK